MYSFIWSHSLAELGSLLEACQGEHILVQTTWGQLELDKYSSSWDQCEIIVEVSPFLLASNTSWIISHNHRSSPLTHIPSKMLMWGCGRWVIFMLDTPVLGILKEAEEVRKHRNCCFIKRETWTVPRASYMTSNRKKLIKNWPLRRQQQHHHHHSQHHHHGLHQHPRAAGIRDS